MKNRTKLSISAALLSFSLLAGCEEASETAKKVTEEVAEAVQVEATKDHEFVLSVKNGSLYEYPDMTVEEAFADFFSSPKWKYFQAETGEHVVEFTGYCMYMEKKVKAKMQFLVEEGVDTFEIGALEFNEIPQDEFTKMGLLEAIYEEEATVAQAEVVVEEDSAGITAPFPIGSTLGDLFEYYGDPTFNDYYLGGKLVVFNDEDGYFLDETDTVVGYMFANPTISIFNTYVGMTPEEISAVLSGPAESYYDEVESQSYINNYYIENYLISYSSIEENGPTTSVIIMEQ